MSALRANEWPLPCMTLLKCGLLTFDRKTIADNPDFKSLEQERSRNLSRWGSHTWTWGDPTLTRPLNMLHLLEDLSQSAFSVRRDLSRQLKASDIYFVTFVTHGIVEERQRAKASLNQEELKRKREQSRRRQQNKNAIRFKHVDIVAKTELNGSNLRSCMLSSNRFTSEECRALLKVTYNRSAASNASRNVPVPTPELHDTQHVGMTAAISQQP